MRLRLGKVTGAAALIAVGVIGGGGALAVADIGSNNTIHSCVDMEVTTAADGSTSTVPAIGHFANVNLIDPSAGQTCADFANANDGNPVQEYDWNVSGPAGTQGAQGSSGAQGAQGATGAAGSPGPAGATGATGATGASGAAGSAGSSITETVLAHVELGTAQQLKLTQAPGSALEFDATSVTYGETAIANVGSSSTGAGAGKVTPARITITKVLDTNSKYLFADAANGHAFASARILVPIANETDTYLELSLTGVRIASDQIVDTTSAEPLEQLSLSAAKVSFLDVSRDALGKQAPPATLVASGWNVTKNTGS